MDISIKKAALLSLLPIFIVVWLGAGLNIFVDPYRVFHTSPLLKKKFHTNSLYATAGYLREFVKEHKKCDSLVVGSSLSQNFLPGEVSQTLGWGPTLMLTWGASRPYEQFIALQNALDNDTVRHVLWEVHMPFLTSSLGETYKGRAFPDNFYSGRILDKLTYVFSIDTFEDSLHVLSHGYLFTGRSKNWSSDREHLNYWMDDALRVKSFEKYNRPRNIAKLNAMLRKADVHNKGDKHCLPAAYPCVDAYLLRTIRSHPNVEFELFYPPLSMFFYHLLNKCKFRNYLAMRTYLARQLDKLPNAHISSFEDVPGLTENLARYKDAIHYDAAANHDMLTWIAKGDHRETLDNVAGNNLALRRKAAAFRLPR